MDRSQAKKYIFSITLLLTIFLPGMAKAQTDKKPGGIVFIENSWIDALHQAQIKNKYIFVDAYASWCGPCKVMRNVTFKNKKAAEFFNANFVNVAIDMEKGDGPGLAEQWGIQ